MRAHQFSRFWLLWLLTCPGPAAAQVRPGIEVLLTDSAHLVEGKRVGLLTNQTGVDRAGRRTVDLLRADPAVRLVMLFSPEHGFRGTEDRPGAALTVDSLTGLPIYNLYGPKQSSDSALLDSLDAVLVDLQDIGARYYTYVSTAVILMERAARRDTPVLVLDRPNPLGGEAVQGNVREHPGLERSFVGFLPVPMRPGMTLGELLLLANDVLGIHARLTVIPVAGWRRGMYFDATGLPWVRPSPSMPDLESALHYPGTCLFEGTNLSVGRGSRFPFQVIGATWVDPVAIIRRIRDEGRGTGDGVFGVELTADTLTPHTPSDGKDDGVRINIIRLRVTDRRRYDPTHMAVALLAAVRAVHPDSFHFVAERFDLLSAGPALRRAILAGRAPAAIWQGWEAGLERFRRGRGKYLLY
jgi:beta-N-acetylhexosaminidase